MPIGKLVFKLPEEREEFHDAQNGVNYHIALVDLDNWLRALVKYEDKTKVTVDEVREKIREILGGLEL